MTEEKFCDICGKCVYSFAKVNEYTSYLVTSITIEKSHDNIFLSEICLDCAKELYKKYLSLKHNKSD